MACELSKRGFDNITILEKSGRIGGKSYSVIDPNDTVHEMGTSYIYPTYNEIRKLLEEYKLKEIDVTEDIAFRQTLWPKQKDAVQTKPFYDWLFEEIEKKSGMPSFVQALSPDFLQSITLRQKGKEYIKLHRKILGKYSYSLPNQPADMKQIDMTFYEFLRRHDLHELLPLFTFIHEVQGYGPVRSVPAFYGLWWNSPEMMERLISLKSVEEGATTMISSGFQSLWEAMARKHRLRIIFNCEVTSIERLESSTTLTCKDPEGEIYEDSCSFLIIAAPIHHMLNVLDCKQWEKEVFGSLECSTLATTLIETNPNKQGKEIPIRFWPVNVIQPNGTQKN